VHLLRDDRLVTGLYGDGLEARLAFFDDLADAGDGAARADAGNQDVGLALGIGPDFLAVVRR